MWTTSSNRPEFPATAHRLGIPIHPSVRKFWKVLLFLVFFVCMGLPVLVVMLKAISGGTQSAYALPGTWTLFHNTVLLGVLVSLISSGLAFLLAWAVVWTGFADRPLIRLIWLIPFMAPPYLTSMGWILFMEPNGYWAHLIPPLGAAGSQFFSLWGLVCVMSLHLFPIPFFPAVQTIRTVLAKYDPVARIHGAAMSYRWWRIGLPLIGPAMIGSTLLVFVKTIGEFGTPLVFGSLVHFPVLTTAIYLQMTTWPINFHAAAQLSALLLGTVWVVWTLHDWYQRRSLSGMDTLMDPVFATHKWSQVLSVGLIVGLGVLSIGIPIGSLILTSVLRVEGNGVHWSNLSLIHYRHIFSGGSGALSALLTSLELGCLAASAVTVFAVLLAVLARFYSSRWAKWTEWLGLLPNAIPDVLLAIGLILFWNSPWWPWTPYETPAILIIGYAVVLFPFSYNYVKVAFFRLRSTIWEAALTHQATRWHTAWRIVAPLTGSALVSGWMMVFGISLRDLVVPMLLSPPDTTVISTYIYGQFDQGSLPDAMALGVLTLIVTVAVFMAVQWLQNRSIASAGDGE